VISEDKNRNLYWCRIMIDILVGMVASKDTRVQLPAAMIIYSRH
jgi:hypothetical protein